MAVGIRDIFGVSTDEIEYQHFDYETQEEEHIQANEILRIHLVFKDITTKLRSSDLHLV